MSYYDRIAKQWNNATGRKGGAFKQHVLNDALIQKIEDVDGLSILEIGAGNGYFLPMLLERRSGQRPQRVVVTDASTDLLKYARRIGGPRCEYEALDVRQPFPFGDKSFDLILSVMMFNELSDSALKAALGECHRVLTDTGRMVGAALHPSFVDSLRKRSELRRVGNGLTMPGADGIRLPVAIRSMQRYERIHETAGFHFAAEDLQATPAVLAAKPA